MSRTLTPGLRALARMHGIQTSYFDVRSERILAPEETLRHLLRSLGVRADTPADVSNALRRTSLSRLQTPTEPVFVAWNGRLPTVEVRTGARSRTPVLAIELEHDGNAQHWQTLNKRSQHEFEVDGHTFTVSGHQYDGILPPGYHTLRWEAGSTQSESLVVSAPSQCYRDPSAPAEWGVFAPLYALREDMDWGAGTYRELERLSRWLHQNGGHLVGTLPILPCFYEQDAEPSPYLPITRLLWSEFFIDVAGVDFVNDCTEAISILSSSGFADERERLNRRDHVDYQAVLRLKRRVLEPLSRYAWSQSDALSSELDAFRRSNPLVEDYAVFRGTLEATQQRWQEWPERLRNGNLESSPVALEARRYHEFVQWLAHRELSTIFEASNTASLYLDLPVGVHPDGYDAWRFRESHITGASCGAPPDTVFTTGQSWMAPPLHPAGIRETGYRYLRLCLQHHMRHCDVLRIDHVMGMHRMFCVPEGARASEGTYIRYRPDEMYAILCLESHRNRTAVVGEDLGTVPRDVRRAMTRHGLNRMFVLYYEMPALLSRGALSVPENSLASISTHDMPPFASIWRGVDIREQAEIGIMDRGQVPSAREERTTIKECLQGWLRTRAPERPSDDEHTMLRSVLSWLAASRARYVIANLEDFWLETRQPNIPGAAEKHPNWVQRIPMTLRQIEHDSRTSDMIGILRKERGRRRMAGKGD